MQRYTNTYTDACTGPQRLAVQGEYTASLTIQKISNGVMLRSGNEWFKERMRHKLQSQFHITVMIRCEITVTTPRTRPQVYVLLFHVKSYRQYPI